MINKALKLYNKHREIIVYGIMGVLATIVCLAVYYLCVFTFLDPSIPWQLQMANIISWMVSVIFAFWTNRKFVFQSENKEVFKEGLKFFESRFLTLIIDMVFMYIFVTKLAFNDKIMKIISNTIVIIANYILSKLFVFIKKEG